jgi:hypothetical protein
MSDEDQDVSQIVKQLKRLQLQQATLLTRLERLSQEGADRNETGPTTGPATRDPPRAFQIGDRVQIRNPGRFQPSTGTIHKIGQSRITVIAANGTKITRAPKNIFRS